MWEFGGKNEDGGWRIEDRMGLDTLCDPRSSILDPQAPSHTPIPELCYRIWYQSVEEKTPDAPIPRCSDSAHRSCRRRDLRNVTAKHSRRSLPYRNRKQKSPAIPVGRRGFLTTRGRRINPSRLLRPWPPATLPRLCWFRWFRFWALLFSRFFSWPWLCLSSFRRSTRPACLFCCT